MVPAAKTEAQIDFLFGVQSNAEPHYSLCFYLYFYVLMGARKGMHACMRVCVWVCMCVRY